MAAVAEPWDDVREHFGWESDVESDDDATMSHDEAQGHLYDYLVESVWRGEIDAKRACIIAYWCQLSGLTGIVSKLALRPDSSSGHFRRKFRSATAHGDDLNSVIVKAPGHSKASMTRIEHSFPCAPIWDIFNDEHAHEPDLDQRHADSIAKGELPRCYFEHPVARDSGFTAFPIAVYMDGFPTFKKDGLLGITVHFLLTQRRHLVTTIRKSRLCRCGCKGWCTLFPIFCFLHHCFASLAEGTFPETQWDGSAWIDSSRAWLAGKALRLKAALLYILGDWAEFCNTIGFINWQSVVSPCIFCICRKVEWTADLALSAIQWPWGLVDHALYDANCAMMEQWRTLSLHARKYIATYLWYDKRSHGNKGRCLRVDLPAFNLLAGDRVEPCRSVRDVAAFETLAGDVTVLFWRISAQGRVRHRNPMLDALLGITLNCISIDSLHTLNLGVMKEFTMHALWELILSNTWGVGDNATEEEMIDASCRHIKLALRAFYASPLGVDVSTPLQDFSVGMIGEKNARCLSTKAAETKGVFMFAVQILREKQALLLRGDVWHAAGQALLDIVELLDAAPMNLDNSTYVDRWGLEGQLGVLVSSDKNI